MKKKYALIDTENVGDRWVNLVSSLKKKEILIVFFTKNHSHLLEKTYLEQQYNWQIRWVECVTGNNALDHQLMGVLSYLIALHPNAAYTIHSNDNGYQEIIHFWKQKGIKVKRVKFSPEKKEKKTKNKKEKPKKKDISPAVPLPVNPNEENIIAEIAKTVPVSNLNGWYKMLCLLLGDELGRSCYTQLKEDKTKKEELAHGLLPNKLERKIYLVSLLYKHNQLDISKAEEAFQIVNAHNKKNKKAIKADFDKHFGNKTSEQTQYYRAIKNVVEILKEE